MSRAQISYEIAAGLFRYAPELCKLDFEALGVKKQDWELLSQAGPWHLPDKARVIRVINALVYGSCEMIGHQRMVIPAEYIACMIAGVVKAVNWRTAAIWMALDRNTGVGALELASQSATNNALQQVTAEQLNALVICCVVSDKDSQVRKQFRQNLGLAVERAEKSPQKGGVQ